jgi:hypothetical protein
MEMNMKLVSTSLLVSLLIGLSGCGKSIKNEAAAVNKKAIELQPVTVSVDGVAVATAFSPDKGSCTWEYIPRIGISGSNFYFGSSSMKTDIGSQFMEAIIFPVSFSVKTSTLNELRSKIWQQRLNFSEACKASARNESEISLRQKYMPDKDFKINRPTSDEVFTFFDFRTGVEPDAAIPKTNLNLESSEMWLLVDGTNPFSGENLGNIVEVSHLMPFVINTLVLLNEGKEYEIPIYVQDLDEATWSKHPSPTSPIVCAQEHYVEQLDRYRYLENSAAIPIAPECIP